MKSTVSVRYISGETTDAIKHNLKVCLEDTSPDNLILHHGTNNLTSGDNSEKSQAILLTLWFMVYISSLIIRNDNVDKKRKEVNDLPIT